MDLPVADLGKHQHSLEIYWPKHNTASNTQYYQTTSTRVKHSARVVDPQVDNIGPTCRYVKPQDPSVGCQKDIAEVLACAAGTVLKIDIEMCDVSTLWAPQNGFDHVSFNLFFDFKEKQGISELPLMGGRYPNLQQWDLAHMVFGWSSYLYSSENATEEKEGHKLGVAPAISVDKANKRIRFTYQGNDFGVENWRGVSIYITTWDKSGEGNYRDLAEKQDVWTFGGGSPQAPKILDDIFIQLSSPSV